jgi:hypothetical protein
VGNQGHVLPGNGAKAPTSYQMEKSPDSVGLPSTEMERHRLPEVGPWFVIGWLTGGSHAALLILSLEVVQFHFVLSNLGHVATVVGGFRFPG